MFDMVKGINGVTEPVDKKETRLCQIIELSTKKIDWIKPYEITTQHAVIGLISYGLTSGRWYWGYGYHDDGDEGSSYTKSEAMDEVKKRFERTETERRAKLMTELKANEDQEKASGVNEEPESAGELRGNTVFFPDGTEIRFPLNIDLSTKLFYQGDPDVPNGNPCAWYPLPADRHGTIHGLVVQDEWGGWQCWSRHVKLHIDAYAAKDNAMMRIKDITSLQLYKGRKQEDESKQQKEQHYTVCKAGTSTTDAMEMFERTRSSRMRANQAVIGEAEREHDITNPPHYTDLEPEPITVIEDWGLGPHLANVLKYIARADRKGAPLDDLRKARWYLDREIMIRERAKG